MDWATQAIVSWPTAPQAWHDDGKVVKREAMRKCLACMMRVRRERVEMRSMEEVREGLDVPCTIGR